MKIKPGNITMTGYRITEKIETLEVFWQVINKDKSIFARDRMYPTAFFHSWSIRLIKQWIDKGYFYTAYKIQPDE